MSIEIIVNHKSKLKEKEVVKRFVEYLYNLFKIDPEKELNIVFTDDEQIQKLNNQFKNKNSPTNVLSFYGYDGNILGDIVISIDTVKTEAEQENRDFLNYLLFIVAHGFLHLLGYTHETMEKFNWMISKQEELVKEFLSKEVEI